MDYHERALYIIDGKLLKPQLSNCPTTEEKQDYKQKVDPSHKGNGYATTVIAIAVTEDTCQKILDKDTAREVREELNQSFKKDSKLISAFSKNL